MTKKTSSQREKLHLLEIFQPNTPAAKMVTDLLQMMIQIDTSNPPGNEITLAQKLEEWIQNQGLENITTKIIESGPSRANLIINITGSDPLSSPSWGFMSHLDVVPAEGEWAHPPFSGEISNEPHDEFIWGRGALDIKDLGAANLTAAITLLKEGFQPKGNLKILLCADEEQGGYQGLGYLIEHNLDDVKVDCCLNEGGGFKSPLKNDFQIQIGEKGIFWTGLKIHGTGGHGSVPPPYNQFAIYKLIDALQNLRRYKPTITMGPTYFQMLKYISLPNPLKWILKRKTIIRSILKLASKLVHFNFDQILLPLVADSIAPTNFHSGIKENSISPDAELVLDIRTLPGHTRETTNKMLQNAFGKKIFKQMEIRGIDNHEATISPIDNPFYERIEKVIGEIYSDAHLVPMLSMGSTDCKFFREKGILAYGFAPLIKDDDMEYSEMMSLAHGKNERISITNLLLSTDFAYRMMKLV